MITIQIDPQDNNRIIGRFNCPQPSLADIYVIDAERLAGVSEACYDPGADEVSQHPSGGAISVPVSISPRQARLVLLAGGLLAAVEAAIAAMPAPEGDAARIEWEYATEIRRDSALLEALGPQLGLTAEQIDQMFIQAIVL